MDYSKLLRKAGCFVIELITIGLIGVLVIFFLINMWETDYLKRYKYVQGQDIKQEILDSKLNSGMRGKNQPEKEYNGQGGILGAVIEGVTGGIKYWFKRGEGKKLVQNQFTYISLEVKTDALIKLKEKAEFKNIGVEKYINEVLEEDVKK